MGLDMNAYRIAAEKLGEAQVDFEIDFDEAVELHYWRKHPNLHGWMQQLYVEKGGAERDPVGFNCVPVRLEEADLDRLETAIRAGNLPETSGFFFGASDGSEWQGDLGFIEKARSALLEGDAVLYSSWW